MSLDSPINIAPNNLNTKANFDQQSTGSIRYAPEIMNNSFPVQKNDSGFFSGIGNIFEGIGSFGANLIEGSYNAIKGIGLNLHESTSDVFSGIRNIFNSNIFEGTKEIGQGLFKATIQTPIDAVITTIGNPLLSIGASSTPLTEGQSELANSIFKDSINSDSVRIKRLPKWSSGLFSKFAGALVIGNDIFVPNNSDINTNKALLAHELTHVWQHQNSGTDYLTEALFAQHFGQGYDVIKPLAEGKSFIELNPEQQGRMMEFIVKQNHSRQSRAILTPEQINDALSYIRAGQTGS